MSRPTDSYSTLRGRVRCLGRHDWQVGYNNGPLHYDKAVCRRCGVSGYKPYWWRFDGVHGFKTWWKRAERNYRREFLRAYYPLSWRKLR